MTADAIPFVRRLKYFGAAADHLLYATDYLLRSGAQNGAHHQDEKPQTDQRESDDKRDGDSAPQGLRIKQEQRPKGKSDSSSYSQNPKSGDKYFRYHKGYTQNNQQQSRIIKRDHIQCIQCDHPGDQSDHSREDTARIHQFKKDTVYSNDQKNIGNIGIGNDREQTNFPIRFKVLY